MTRLSHANLVTLVAVCMDSEPLLMVLDYLPGGSLDKWLDVNHALASLDDKVAILHQVAAGASALHAAGVVHRDIAARNVLIGAGFMVKLADFGLSRDLSAGSAYERASA